MCRTFTETASDDISNSGFLDVTLGIAGSAGLFVTTNFEFSVTASRSEERRVGKECRP